ncbi:placenta-specific gene 8 protein-like [Astyanax mexicanus]|uniref:Plac8 onzin related protein 10 n=1 Tax=Astyanax mexicanus TaxID=7994 RepID=A0A3B1JYC1_ASTMX|nr:placenta-specific gene 8 protein-like [Astyanax mexicanus]
MAGTTVVVQPAPKAVPRVTFWTTGLCDCCQDMNNCCFAFWCCPCHACSTTEKFGENRCLPLVDICGPAVMAAFGVAICVPPVALSMRVAVRYRYQISGDICEDIAITCFCAWCSWCQMNREITQRQQRAMVISSQPVVPVVTTQPAAVIVSAV